MTVRTDTERGRLKGEAPVRVSTGLRGMCWVWGDYVQRRH